MKVLSIEKPCNLQTSIISRIFSFFIPGFVEVYWNYSISSGIASLLLYSACLNSGHPKNSKQYSSCQNSRHKLNSGHPQNSKHYSACQNSRHTLNTVTPRFSRYWYSRFRIFAVDMPITACAQFTIVNQIRASIFAGFSLNILTAKIEEWL